MNVKKGLESRIRGWFPKEPLLPTYCSPMHKAQTLQTPFDKENMLNLNANELRPMVILVLPLLLFVGYLELYGIAADHYSALPELLIGVSAGSLVSFFWTRQILSKLIERGQFFLEASAKGWSSDCLFFG